MQSSWHCILCCLRIFNHTALLWGNLLKRSSVNQRTFSWCCVWGSSPSGCASSAYQTESGCCDSSAPYSNSTPEGSQTMLSWWQMLLCSHRVVSFIRCHAERWLLLYFYLVLMRFYLLQVFLAELFEFLRLFLQELQIALMLLQLLHGLDLNVWGHRETESWGWSLNSFIWSSQSPFKSMIGCKPEAQKWTFCIKANVLVWSYLPSQ